MAVFDIRFVGRLVFVDHFRNNVPTGVLDVAAMHMQVNGDVGADAHRLLLSAQRTIIAPPATGARRPDLVVIASVHDTDEFDQGVWDLSDCDVTLSATGGFRWADRTKLADLDQLLGVTGQTGRVRLDTLRDPRLLQGRVTV